MDSPPTNPHMFRHLTLLLAALTATSSLFATSIVPFTSLGAMLDASEVAVKARTIGTYEETVGETTFYGYELELLEAVKGSAAGSTIRIEASRLTTFADGSIAEMDAEFALTTGEVYMLFLRQSETGYVPLTGSLGIYIAKGALTGGEYFVPMPAFDVHILDHPSGEEIEPRRIYPAAELIDMLRLRLMNPQVRVEKAATNLTYAAFPSVMAMPTPPSQCNSIMSNFGGALPTRPVRWSTPNITIFHNATNPSVGATNAHALVQTMVQSINMNYMGLNLSYGGIVPIGGNQCLNDARNAGSGSSITISFQNTAICMQTGLSGCSGTLGIGGPAFSSQVNTAANGVQYYTITTGGVVIDKDAGCVGATGYVRLLEHEVTHALGFNHITTQTANMNPTCCISIQQADIECLDFVYAPAPLPVQLVSFDAVDKGATVEATWATASETNSSSFAVQRSIDGDRFETIGELNAKGNSRDYNNYTFIDYRPLTGVSYYRLMQEDIDGTQEALEVVAVERDDRAALLITPNPVKAGQVLTLTGLSAAVQELSIVNIAGQEVLSYSLTPAGGQLSIPLPQNLPEGLYYLRSLSDSALKSEVLQVSN